MGRPWSASRWHGGGEGGFVLISYCSYSFHFGEKKQVPPPVAQVIG